MTSAFTKTSKIVLVFSVAALLLAGSFGLPHLGMAMEMDMDGNMTMSDCYMPGMTAICNMTPLEHISSWQSMFTSIPAQNLLVALLLLVLAVIVGFSWIQRTLAPPERHAVRLFSHQREYIPLHSQLQELFSQGILNPKLF